MAMSSSHFVFTIPKKVIIGFGAKSANLKVDISSKILLLVSNPPGLMLSRFFII